LGGGGGGGAGGCGGPAIGLAIVGTSAAGKQTFSVIGGNGGPGGNGGSGGQNPQTGTFAQAGDPGCEGTRSDEFDY